MPNWTNQLTDVLFNDAYGGLAGAIEGWDNRRMTFESMEDRSSVHGASPEVVVHTVSGRSYRGQLTMHDPASPTVWVDVSRDSGGMSWEIAKRHIEAIEHVIPGWDGVADGQ